MTTYLAVYLLRGARLRFWRNARELVERTLAVAAFGGVCRRGISATRPPRVAIGSSRCLANASDLGAWAYRAGVDAPGEFGAKSTGNCGAAAALISLF